MAQQDICLASWFARRAALTPYRKALTFESKSWTFAELQIHFERLAADLRAHGVCRYDRVGYVGPNHPSFFHALFATAHLGAIFVPLNFRLTGPELAFQIRQSGVHTLIAASDVQPLIDEVADAMHVSRYLSIGSASGRWEEYPGLGDDAPIVEGPPLAGPDDVAVIMYTSGTTGTPKGAMLSHTNIFWCNVNTHLASDLIHDEVSLVVVPLFHIGGLNGSAMATWQKGGEIVLQANFEPDAVLLAIAQHGVTTMAGVPAMFQAMAQRPGFDSADLSTVRTFRVGAAPVPGPMIQLFLDRGVVLQQAYGMTESSGLILVMDPGSVMTRVGSAGRPGLFTDVILVDTEGHVVGNAGERGEIWARGPQIMRGYWNRPAATGSAIDPDGWLHTGDVAYIDTDGYYYLVDRTKHLIITGGENVYPAEVENVVFDHPAVADVAVVGMPNERWGENVVAAVVLNHGSTLTIEELREFAGLRLARFKLPTRLFVVEGLPRTANGKIMKHVLRTQLASQLSTE